MESKKNYASVKQVQYVKDRLFELEQKLDSNLVKVEQLKNAFAANVARVAEKIAAYNSIASQVNSVIDVAEHARVELAESTGLPKRLPVIDAEAFIEGMKV